ncbi:MAG: Rieske 2Fe-2S domain-containing protein [Chitinophagaceae bacterium]|nr:Rieske 2Fe-2S domain-containing protein [Chitinophagaceae bacterium]
MSLPNFLKWYKVAESTAEIEKVLGNPCLVKAAGKEICISVYQGELRACAARCPHAGGQMHKGWIDPQGRVVCPLHQYKFDPKTGRNTSGEGYFIKTYEVLENDDGVFVGM